ncbi:MAG: carboxylating nicotinate-nucleotide diphosphorylase [Xanthomonadales bacterium]|jgi:nicotinate-nucleotide pyrophosphorylase (carboxylating)|nr:carboxylating nicotinate-nucleotide diphosphorylase [Xanthomonadales bacterium]
MHAPPPDQEVIERDVARALAEDVGDGDLTAALLAPDTTLRTRVLCREYAVLCGRPWFDETFRQVDERIAVRWLVEEGASLAPDTVVCEVNGPAAPLLTGERTALNFLQTLSGTATVTQTYAQSLAGTSTRLLDTRKTLPGLRQAQKYAVRCGGGSNHRMGLFDAILIKENHIRAAGSLGAAVRRALEEHPGVPVEVEVETLAELDEAIAAGAHRALLDNFDLDGLRTAVQRAEGQLELEASGNVTGEQLYAIAGTGVDFISTGAITKHLRAVDFSLRFVDESSPAP